MTIFLDFDGTVVEHCYPKIGKINPGSFKVINKLHNAGHRIVLNTYRADCADGTKEEAVMFMNNCPYLDFNILETTSLKKPPPQWENPNPSNILMYIDDNSVGIPMRDGFHVGTKMVNWEELDKLFEKNGIYNMN